MDLHLKAFGTFRHCKPLERNVHFAFMFYVFMLLVIYHSKANCNLHMDLKLSFRKLNKFFLSQSIIKVL